MLAGSCMWKVCAEIQEELRKLQSLHTEDGVFWISYTDFTRAFNRLFVTQLFPPTWHQLTLHSGLQAIASRHHHSRNCFQLPGTVFGSANMHRCALQVGMGGPQGVQCMCTDERILLGAAIPNLELQLGNLANYCYVLVSKTPCFAMGDMYLNSSGLKRLDSWSSLQLETIMGAYGHLQESTCCMTLGSKVPESCHFQ